MLPPPVYPPIPHPPRPPRRAARLAVALCVAGAALSWTLVIAAVLGDWGGSGGSGAAPASTPSPAAQEDASPAPTEDTASLDRRKLTEVSVLLAWNSSSESEKDSMCAGIIVYGPDWVADQLRIGAGNENLDWDYAAELLDDECASR